MGDGGRTRVNAAGAGQAGRRALPIGDCVPDSDLRIGNRRVMQRTAQGGHTQRDDNTATKAATEAKIGAGIRIAMEIWEEISSKIRVLDEK